MTDTSNLSPDLRYYNIDPLELKQGWEAGTIILVDIREEEEILQGTLQKTLFVPLSKIKQLTSMGINPVVAMKLPSNEKKMLLYCAGGRRVIEAAQLLKPYYSQVFPIRWGYSDLMNFGFSKRNFLHNNPTNNI